MKNIKLFLLFVSISWCSFSQSIVKGEVMDQSGIPIPGVNILEKGTSNGAVTDFDGSYQISVSSNAILIFSYVGYKSQEINVSGKSTINITMEEDIEGLSEVVVIGYGVQKKASVLSSISQIKGDEITAAGSPNIATALTGISPGLSVVQTSGQPGADTGELFIRGNADPLILIDGVEVVGGFSNIDPRDVASISVLKDGGATAVYGVRGSNGVIIITTKRGTLGKPKVSFTSEYTVKTISTRPDLLNSFQAQSALNQGILNDQNYGAGYTSEEDLANYRSGEFPYRYPNTNWSDFLLNDTAESYNQTLSVTGGTEFVKYYASVGYLNEGDILKTEQFYNYDPTFKFERYSFRANLDFKISNTTKLRTSISSRFEDANKAGSSDNDPSILAIYTAPPGGVVPIYPEEVLEQYPDPLYPGLVEARFGSNGNIYWGLNNNGSRNSLSTVFNVDLELEQGLDFITEGLKFIGKYNYVSNYNTVRTTTFDSAIQARIDRYDLNRDGTWFSFEGRNYERPYDFNINDENIGTNSDITTYRFQLLYNRVFGKHSVGGTALFRRDQRLVNTEFPSYLEDWVGRFTYDYDNKYFLEVSGAYNGDETFGLNYRFRFFPAISGGINLAKEKFISDNFSVLNNFKVRYSYGENGDREGLKIQNTNPARYNRFQYLSFLDNGSGRTLARYYFGEDLDERLSTYVVSQLGNETLTWAKVIKQNIGVDFGFFNNKLSGSVDFFKENRVDQIGRLTTATVPGYLGIEAALPFVNFNESENKGYEVSLTYKNTTSYGLKYALTGFYGYNNNRVVLSVLDGVGTPSYATVAGKPAGTTGLLQADGFFQNIDELVNYPDQAGNPGLGDYRYVDYNANGNIAATDIEDLVRFDLPTNPRNSYSFNFNLEYKNWSLNGLVDGIFNHERIINANLAYLLPNGAAAGRIDQLDYWTVNNTDATYPALHTGENTSNPNLIAGHTSRIVNLDYIKLRSLNLGYTFNMSESSTISNLKLYLSGNNLITISEIDYGDPQGNSAGQYPILRRINLGLNVSF